MGEKNTSTNKEIGAKKNRRNKYTNEGGYKNGRSVQGKKRI